MNPRSVLIVDDDANVQKALARVLDDEGYQILTADNGREGLKILADHEVDVVISDQRMPGMTGMDFLAVVQSLYPHVMSILLTAHANLDIALVAINDTPVFKFMLKPWDENGLKRSIRQAMGVGRSAQESFETTRTLRTKEEAMDDAELEAWLKALEQEIPGTTNKRKVFDRSPFDPLGD